ncbi:hypothetical protein [Oceanicella sp. SM1341]|uniref:hypothetical protein n=1 Tax=Oceanicella sp. SM1341 TaxID=1548889 RepID=UPI000E4D6A73|nr:hypothetical protein [Oceanicella sp. SM1341]
MRLRLIRGGAAPLVPGAELRAPVWRRFDLESVGEAGELISGFLQRHPDFYPGRLLGHLMHVPGPRPSEEDIAGLAAMSAALSRHQELVLRLDFGPARGASAQELSRLLLATGVELADVFAAVCMLRDDLSRLVAAGEEGAPGGRLLLQGMGTVLMLDLSQVADAYLAEAAGRNERAARRPLS